MKTRALLWELWRISRWELLLRIGFQCLFLVAAYSTITKDDATRQIFQGIMLFLMTIWNVFSATWMGSLDNSKQGFSFQLGFTRPLSTTMLVCVPLAYIAGTCMFSYILPAIIVRIFTGTQLPIAGPATFIGCMVTCFAASVWSPTQFWLKVVCLAAVLAGSTSLAIWYVHDPTSSDPFLYTLGARDTLSLGWLSYGFLLLATACALGVTVWSVDGQRHGTSMRLSNPFEGGTIDFARCFERKRPFRGPASAQFWYEMRRGGMKVLVVAGFCSLFVFLAISYANTNVESLRGKSMLIWLMVLGVCPFIYQIFGAEWAIGLQLKQAESSLSKFDATRGMRNDQLIGIKLAVVAVSSLSGWAMMALAATVHTCLLGDPGDWRKLADHLRPVLSRIGILEWVAIITSTVLSVFVCTAVLMTFVFVLRRFSKVIFGLTVVAYILFSLVILDAHFGWKFLPVWIASGWLVAAAIVAGTIYVVTKSLKTNSLGKSAFAVLVVFWLVYVATAVDIYQKLALLIPQVPLSVVAVGIAMMLIPLAAAGAAPLSLASHRHQ